MEYPNFYLIFFIFWWLKCSVYLNRRVFVMCINRGQKPESDLAHAYDDANPHIFRMVEGTFSLDATHFIIHIIMQIYTCDPTLYLFSKASMRKWGG